MSSNNSNWRDVLKAQYADLEQLEEMDKELKINEQTITANIDKILKNKRPLSSNYNKRYSENERSNITENILISSDIDNRQDFMTNANLPSYQNDSEELLVNDDINNDTDNIQANPAPISPEILPKAPETASRLMKAKIKMLEKQLEDSNQIRKHMNDQIIDLQRQIKVEKEETKQLKKRIQILETDNRRTVKKTGEATTSENSNEQLLQEISQLKKESQAAQRIAKQNEQNSKTLDTQLKRALETITRLKSQVAEQQQQNQQSSGSIDKSAYDNLEQKVKLIEKQKVDLIAAFKKQMKLIDVLKRQKAHLEVAKLINFTEEEFTKTLDWAA
mmetsp:Transcript_20401/g.18538  ORF Transcript_20401/g.18538 Transcript_20401/m.18538 type:complete len:332 (-) Transcript_20401:111-1106(-)